jgi:hypothetical protein
VHGRHSRLWPGQVLGQPVPGTDRILASSLECNRWAPAPEPVAAGLAGATTGATGLGAGPAVAVGPDAELLEKNVSLLYFKVGGLSSPSSSIDMIDELKPGNNLVGKYKSNTIAMVSLLPK